MINQILERYKLMMLIQEKMYLKSLLVIKFNSQFKISTKKTAAYDYDLTSEIYQIPKKAIILIYIKSF